MMGLGMRQAQGREETKQIRVSTARAKQAVSVQYPGLVRYCSAAEAQKRDCGPVCIHSQTNALGQTPRF